MVSPEWRGELVESNWRALTFPLAPFLLHTGRGRRDGAWLVRKHVGNSLRNGRTSTVCAQ